MSQKEFCNKCNQKHSCQTIYQQLGQAKGPSVARKVIVAFLLPIIVFIVSLAVFQEILANTMGSKQLQTALSFLLALSVTFGVILIIKVINSQLNKNK